MSSRPASALTLYLSECKEKLRAQPEFAGVTGLQLQNLALIRWRSPGVDCERKEQIIAMQAAALEEWACHTKASTPPTAGDASAGPSHGKATQPHQPMRTAQAAGSQKRGGRQASQEHYLRLYIEACGGTASMVDGWSIRLATESRGQFRASHKKGGQISIYVAPDGKTHHSRSDVARTCGLTPLDNSKAQQLRFQVEGRRSQCTVSAQGNTQRGLKRNADGAAWLDATAHGRKVRKLVRHKELGDRLRRVLHAEGQTYTASYRAIGFSSISSLSLYLNNPSSITPVCRGQLYQLPWPWKAVCLKPRPLILPP